MKSFVFPSSQDGDREQVLSQTYQKLLLWLFNWVELGFVEYSFPIAHCPSNNSVKFNDSALCCHLLTNSLTFNELKNETYILRM